MEASTPQAESLYVSVVDGRRRALGDEHPDTLDARALVGRVGLLQQKYLSSRSHAPRRSQGL